MTRLGYESGSRHASDLPPPRTAIKPAADPGTVVHLNARKLRIIYPQPGPAWAITIRIRGWLRPRLEVERGPIPTRPDPGRP